MHNWRDLMTYPQWVESSVAATLDAAHDLLPAKYDYDLRFVALADWLRSLEQIGLITAREHGDIRNALGPHV